MQPRQNARALPSPHIWRIALNTLLPVARHSQKSVPLYVSFAKHFMLTFRICTMTVDIQLHFCFDVVERVAGQRMHGSIDCAGEDCASRDESDSGERASEKERVCACMSVRDGGWASGTKWENEPETSRDLRCHPLAAVTIASHCAPSLEGPAPCARTCSWVVPIKRLPSLAAPCYLLWSPDAGGVQLIMKPFPLLLACYLLWSAAAEGVRRAKHGSAHAVARIARRRQGGGRHCSPSLTSLSICLSLALSLDLSLALALSLVRSLACSRARALSLSFSLPLTSLTAERKRDCWLVACIHTYMHTYIHTYMHTYILHAYMHTARKMRQVEVKITLFRGW